jgi:hypothetical protein
MARRIITAAEKLAGLFFFGKKFFSLSWKLSKKSSLLPFPPEPLKGFLLPEEDLPQGLLSSLFEDQDIIINLKVLHFI